MNDQRQDQRTPLRLEVIAHWGVNKPALHGVSIDLSMSGILVRLKGHVPIGRRLDLVIRGQSPEVIIATSGIVVHRVKGSAVGIRFARQSERTEQLLLGLLQGMKRSA